MNEAASTELPDVRATRDAYDDVAQLYADMFADALDTMPYDRAMLGIFAELVRANGSGLVADIGCGPGRLTTHLDALGLEVFGLDLSPEMIRLARDARPDLRYEVGTMEELPLADASLSGIVSWYSLIHLPPERINDVLAEFKRVLRPDGHLLLAFQAAEAPHDLQPHDGHKVTRSYRWSLRRMEELVQAAGFHTDARLLRERQPGTPEKTQHGYLIATASAPEQ